MKHSKDAMAVDFSRRDNSLGFKDVIRVASSTYTIAAARTIIDDYLERQREGGFDREFVEAMRDPVNRSRFWRFANSLRAAH